MIINFPTSNVYIKVYRYEFEVTCEAESSASIYSGQITKSTEGLTGYTAIGIIGKSTSPFTSNIQIPSLKVQDGGTYFIVTGWLDSKLAQDEDISGYVDVLMMLDS